MDEREDKYEKMFEQVYLESEFKEITNVFKQEDGSATWFILPPAESRDYLKTLIDRILVEEVELENLFQSPAAQQIYRRAETGVNFLVDSNEDLDEINQEITVALTISQKLKWVAQKELASELLNLLDSGQITQIGFSFADELIPIL